MKNRFKLNIFLVTLAVILIGVLWTIETEGLPVRNIQVEGGSLGNIFLQPECKTGNAILDKVEIAKKLLKTTPKLEFEEVPRRSVLSQRQIQLAILDTETCDVFYRTYWLDEDEIRTANTLRRIYQDNPGTIPEFVPVSPDSKIKVLVRWWNTFNSDLVVVEPDFIGPSDPAKYIVLANKYLLGNNSFAYPQEITGKKYSDIVYSPYSKEIHFLTLAEEGRNILTAVDEVYEELKNLKIESQINPGTLVTDWVSATLVKELLINEQVEPSLMFNSSDGGLFISERVLVRYGLNREKTFRYTYSKTGAAGAGQIMPRTYSYPAKDTGVLEKYPSANLIKDVDIGRVDFKNGIKATFLVFDDHFATVARLAGQRTTWKRVFNDLTKNKEERDVVMMGIYNGGPSKYDRSKGEIVTSNKETADFVRKYKMIRELHLFD